MFAMSWVVTVGPRPDDLWVIDKDYLATLAPPAPKGRAQHVFRQCPLDAEIVSHLSCYVVIQYCILRYLYSTLTKLTKLILRNNG